MCSWSQVDWSGNHSASRPDALIASRLNSGWGGKQPVPHDSFISPEHAHLMLGGGKAEMCINGQVVNCKLKPGDTQRFYFTEPDPPPFRKPGAPKYNTPKVDKYGQQLVHKKTKEPLFEEGYVDKPKGMEQVASPAA